MPQMSTRPSIVAAIFFEVKGIIAENEIRVKIFLT